MFYAGATDMQGFGSIYASDDGSVWKLVYKEAAKDNKQRAYGFFGFARGNGITVAAGGGDGITRAGNCRLLATRDGTAWEGPVWRRESGMKRQGAFNCIAFGNGRFVCHGGKGENPAFFSYSADGKQWADPDKNMVENWRWIWKLVFGNGLFLGVGANRRVLTSTDGATWRDHADNEGTRPPFISLAFGNGVFVAGGMHGLRAMTKDGEKWEHLQEGEVGEHLNEIVWTGTEFVALGIEVTYRSPDGAKWSKSPSDVRAARGCFGAGVFVCSNLRGTQTYCSTDAVRWKPLPKIPETLFTGALAYFD